MESGMIVIVGCDLEHCIENDTKRTLLNILQQEIGTALLPTELESSITNRFQLQLHTIRDVREDNLVLDTHWLGLKMHAAGAIKEGFPSSTDLPTILSQAEAVRSLVTGRGFQGPIRLAAILGNESGSTIEPTIQPTTGGDHAQMFIGYNVMKTLVDTRRGTKTLYRALHDGDHGSFNGSGLQVDHTELRIITCSNSQPDQSGIEMYLGMIISAQLPDPESSADGSPLMTRYSEYPVDILTSLTKTVSQVGSSIGISESPHIHFLSRSTDQDTFRFHNPSTLELLQLRVRSVHGYSGPPPGQAYQQQQTYIPPVQPEIIYQPQPGQGSDPYSNQRFQVSYDGRTFTASNAAPPGRGFAAFAHYVNAAEMRKNLWTLFIAGFIFNIFFVDTSGIPEPLSIFVNSLAFLAPFILFYIYTRAQITSGNAPSGYGQAGGQIDRMRIHGETFWLFSWCCLFITFDFLRLGIFFTGLDDLFWPLWIGLFFVWFKYLGNKTMMLYYKLFVPKRE